MTPPLTPHHVLTGPPGAPVLVLANSLGTDLSMWDGVAAALGGRFRLVRFDHRGHGGSPVLPGPYQIADLGRDLLALLDTLGLDRVSYCGLSLGGMVGMWLAAHAPERVDRLALCCTSAWLPPAEGWLDRAARVRAGGTAAVADVVLGRWFSPEWAASHPAEVERARAMLVSVPPEGYAGCCEAIAGMDLRADLPSIAAETLVVAGGNDFATPPSHGKTIAAALPQARFVVLPQPAHLAAVEQPDAVAGLLLDHFKEASGDS
jgi:3-oxoadipate enol-lactonase